MVVACELQTAEPRYIRGFESKPQFPGLKHSALKANVFRFDLSSLLYLAFYLQETTCLRGEINWFNDDEAAVERETELRLKFVRHHGGNILSSVWKSKSWSGLFCLLISIFIDPLNFRIERTTTVRDSVFLLGGLIGVTLKFWCWTTSFRTHCRRRADSNGSRLRGTSLNSSGAKTLQVKL